MIYTKIAKSEAKLCLLIKQIFKPTELNILALGNQESFIYSTADGRKYGIKKDNKQLILPILYPDNAVIINYYQKFYVLDINKSCVEALNNIIKGNNLYQETATRLLSDKGKGNWTCIGGEIYYTNEKGTKIPTILMPYYELLELRRIRELNYTPVILCASNQAKVIQHIIHKEPLFIDYQTLKPIKESIPIYTEQGQLKGRAVLLDYLKSKNLTVSHKELISLPSKYNQTPTDFYNAIANKQISIESILPNIQTTEYVKKVKHHIKHQTVTVENDIYEQIKQYAIDHNRTIKWATKQILLKGLDENSK